ncbi:MAG: tRNA (adenosine(37)-N6)-threonylcarbamoyltransferase complex dimerization subunit type 1 TsaB [Bacteroidota bacterium]|nr:tRNA (adenosine(37)-N6)-threonylcarbamoyltransferase complex dimerization subunit type 1 TsaB [Bacteroidota bacterium]
MPLILNIDTATETATVAISEENRVVSSFTNSNQKDHASFLQPAIKKILKEAGLNIKDLNAVAVTSGPGSYTGLRVGMASAKGLCYALNIPLITINTLEVMALSAIFKIDDKESLYCPMIDARRTEVYTAIYTYDLKEIIKPCALILSKETLKSFIENSKIYFLGNGSLKLRSYQQHDNALFIDIEISSGAIVKLSYKNYKEKNFADVTYASPLYIKEFYTIASKTSS